MIVIPLSLKNIGMRNARVLPAPVAIVQVTPFRPFSNSFHPHSEEHGPATLPAFEVAYISRDFLGIRQIVLVGSEDCAKAT